MTYYVEKLRNESKFKDFLKDVKALDRFKRLKSYYHNIYDFIDHCNELNTSRDLIRVEDLSEKQIYEKRKGNIEIESYYEIEIDYALHIRFYGTEYLEDYDQENECYNLVSFGFVEKIEIV